MARVGKRNTSFHNHVSVDCVVFGFDEHQEKLEALLIEQKDPEQQTGGIFKPQLALPGNLVEEEEGLDSAAERVLNELTGLEGLYLKQFFAFGDPARVRDEKDASWLASMRPSPEARVITIAYFAVVRKEDIQPGAGSFAKRTLWANAYRLPKLAFDHNQIVKKALEDIREYVQEPELLRKLLPEKFTLTQFQTLVQLILNTMFDKRNFRKSIKGADYLLELDEKQQGVLHKPAKLYSFEKKRVRK